MFAPSSGRKLDPSVLHLDHVSIPLVQHKGPIQHKGQLTLTSGGFPTGCIIFCVRPIISFLLPDRVDNHPPSTS